MEGRHRATRRHSVADVPKSSGKNEVPNHAVFQQKVPVAPDGGWGWMVCLAAFCCNFIIVGLTDSMGILLVGLTDVFDNAISELSLVGGLFRALTVLVAPIASGLLIYFSHRTLMIASSLLGFIAIFISVFSPNIEMIIVMFGLIGGIASGLSYFTTNVIVGLYFDKKRAMAVSIASCGVGIGVCTMSILIEKLLQYYGLKGTIILISGLVLNMVVFGALYRPLQYNVVSNGDKQNSEILFKPQQQQGDVCNPGSTARPGSDGGDIKETDTVELSLMIDDTARLENVSKDEQSEMPVNSASRSFKKECLVFFDISVLKNSNFLLLVISYFLWSFNVLVLTYVPVYALSVGLNRDEVSTLMSIIGLCTTFGQLLVGFIIHFLHIKSDVVFIYSLLGMGSCTIAILYCNSYLTQAINIAFWGTLHGCSVSLRLLLSTDIAGIENISKGYGLVYDITGSFITIFYVTGMCIYLASVLTAIIIYRRRKIKEIDM